MKLNDCVQLNGVRGNPYPQNLAAMVKRIRWTWTVNECRGLSRDRAAGSIVRSHHSQFMSTQSTTHEEKRAEIKGTLILIDNT